MLAIKVMIGFLATDLTTGFGLHRLFGKRFWSQHNNIKALTSNEEKYDVERGFETHRVKRLWTGGRNSMYVDWVLPEDASDIRGVIFFLHGFSQEPKAYRPTLEHVSNQLKVAIFAPEVDLDSPQVLEDVAGKVGDSQFCLQRALAFDAIQCIDMTIQRQPPFSNFLPSSSLPIGVAGHSMGGGLSWFVASRFPKTISYVAALAPFPGVPAFAPTNAIAPRHSMHVAGSWDFLAKPSQVHNLTATANSVYANSSVYVEIARGLHTGFEDDLVLFNVPITSLTWTFWYFQIFGLVDLFLLNVVIEPLLTSKVQINLARALLEYTFDAMLNEKAIDADDLWASLLSSEDVEQEWLKRVKVQQ